MLLALIAIDYLPLYFRRHFNCQLNGQTKEMDISGIIGFFYQRVYVKKSKRQCEVDSAEEKS